MADMKIYDITELHVLHFKLWKLIWCKIDNFITDDIRKIMIINTKLYCDHV